MSTRSFRYSTMVQHFGKGRMASTDRDALAFIEAAGIYNTNQQKAIVDLVRSLKRVGLWSKMKAIYPFIGGTASSHKWNLKDPRDLDAAYRLTFSGGWTHSSTGADPNGTNAFADTYFKPQSNLSSSSGHISFYSRENTIGTIGGNFGCDIACGNNADQMIIIARWANGNAFYGDAYNGSTNRITVADSNAAAYFILSRSSSTLLKSFRNATNTGSNTFSSSGFANLTMNQYLAAYNLSGSATYWSNRECAFATIGDGLTDSDATALYNIVDLYQKRLGRAV